MLTKLCRRTSMVQKVILQQMQVSLYQKRQLLTQSPHCFLLFHSTVKPLNSGHLRVLKNLSVIKRCPLLGGSLTKTFTFGTKYYVRYSWHVRYLGCPLLSGFTVHITRSDFLIQLYIIKFNSMSFQHLSCIMSLFKLFKEVFK